MTRTYCDKCGDELTKKNACTGSTCLGGDRLAREIKIGNRRFMVEVVTGLDGVWNAGHFCHDCVLALVAAIGRKRGK